MTLSDSISKSKPKVTSFVKKPRQKIEVITNEENSIVLKDINIDDINKKYSLISKPLFASDGTITSSSQFVKPIVEKSFSVVDENVVKKNREKSLNDFIQAEAKSRVNKSNDITTLTSSLEKLGISNKEIIQSDTYFKDDTGKEIRMIISGTNEFIKKDNDTPCWWCRHPFPKEWHPLGLPVKYINKEFHCEGIFCSFNCIMAYLHTNDTLKYRECGQLVTLLYRAVFGKICWTERLFPAPSWKNLREYGGKLTIDEFRKTFNKLQIVERSYLPTPLPIQPLHTIHLVEKS